MKKLNLQDATCLGKGGMGAVYRVDNETLVKLYYNQQSLEAITYEKTMARKALILGIPTAISFDIVDCDGVLGVVYEALGSVTLANKMSQATPEELEQWIQAYVDIAKKFHSTVTTDQDIPNMKEYYQKLIDKVVDVYSQENIEKCRRLVNVVPDCDYFLHGDLHARNLMVVDDSSISMDSLISIDMNDIGRGHPVFDIGANYLTGQISQPQVRVQNIGLDGPLSEYVWKRFMQLYFADAAADCSSVEETEAFLARRTSDIMPFGLLKLALAPALKPDMPEKYTSFIAERCRTQFFPYIDKMIENLRLDEWKV